MLRYTWILPVEIEAVELPLVHEGNDGIDERPASVAARYHLRVLLATFAPSTDGDHDADRRVAPFECQGRLEAACAIDDR